jgi:S-adenosylmethionine/arginine decarboxylase-like enzyme
MALHNQLLVNGVSDNPPIGEEELKQWLRDLVRDIDMKIVMGPMAFYVTKEGNRGVTAIVGIETSHIAIHVWDEPVPALIQFDLYTCSHLPVDLILEKLKKDFGLRDYKHMVIERAHEFNILEHK